MPQQPKIEAGPFPGESKEEFFSPDKLSQEAWGIVSTNYHGRRCPVQPDANAIPVLQEGRRGTGCETKTYPANWHPDKKGELDLPALYKKANEQNVQIKNEQLAISPKQRKMAFGGALGSGVIVGKKGDEILVMTDNHVVSPNRGMKIANIEARFSDGQVYEGRVVAHDAKNDAAIVAFKTGRNTDKEFHPATVQDQWTKFKDGNQYLTTGYPEATSLLHASVGTLFGLDHSSKAVNMERLPGEDRNRFWGVLSQHTRQGNSGGATYDNEGTLVGTLEAGAYGNTKISFINPISKQYVNKLLKQAGSDTRV